MFLLSRLHTKEKPLRRSSVTSGGYSTPRSKARTPALELLEDRNLLSFLPPVHYDMGGPGHMTGTVAVYKDAWDLAYRLAIPNQASDEVRLFTGNIDSKGYPNGTFRPAGTINTGAGTGPFDTQTLYDYNGDGILDMAVANRNNGTLSIYLGNGDGTYQPYPIGTYLVGKEPAAVTTLPLRRNTQVYDIAVPNFGDGSVTILLGNGDGTFKVGQTIPTGSASEYVIGRDFDGDGNMDIVTANRGSNTISVLMGNGDGTFRSPRYYAVGNTSHSNPADAVPGDFRNLGDGTFDLATANFGEGTVSVLLGNHDGTFQPAKTYPVGINPHGDGDVNPHFVSTGDYDGDGNLDLAVANMCDGGLGTVSILLGNGDGTFQPARNFDVGLGMGSLYVAAGFDLNGDGLPDLIVANQLAGKFSVLINDGNWSGTVPPGIAAHGQVRGVHQLVAREVAGILPLQGNVVSGDAVFSYPDVAETIGQQGGDHVFVVKDNQAEPKARIMATWYDDRDFSPVPRAAETGSRATDANRGQGTGPAEEPPVNQFDLPEPALQSAG